MELPDLRNFDLTGKKVLLRVDYDVPLIEHSAKGIAHREVKDDTRIVNSLPTINHLLLKKAKIIILSHLGRPEGKIVQELSLSPVVEKLQELLAQVRVKLEIGPPAGGWKLEIGENEIVLLENLRFDPGEGENNPDFAQKLASLGDFYINDAFAVCHRVHASIFSLPQQFKSKSKNSVAVGLSLLKEVEVLSGILEKPKRPVAVIFGGIKEDKLEAISGLLKLADYILIGGKLPQLIQHTTYNIQHTNRIVVAGLNQEGKDITLEAVEKFIEVIQKAGTIIWSGPMGQYEVNEWASGTKAVAEAVVSSSAFKIIGGGDTEAALTKFGLVEKIDYISSGGGAMLEFLADGDLPGLKVLRV